MKNKNRILRAHAFGPLMFASDTEDSLNVIVRITNNKILDNIISGKSRGLSPIIITKKWECSVCHQDFEECPHEIGKQYGKTTCQTIAKNIEYGDPSIVDNPADPRCRIIDLLIVNEGNKQVRYDWYGFRPNNDLDHSKNIQEALESGLIPEKAAFHFDKFFSINLTGHVHYP